MNDFPRKSFPATLNPSKKKRNTFSVFGRHGNVDSSNDCTKEINCQYIPHGFHYRNERLSANIPTLPLFKVPESGGYLDAQQQRVLETVWKIKNYRKWRGRNYSKEINEAGKWLTSMRDGSFVSKKIIKRIQNGGLWKLAEMYNEIKDSPTLSIVNAECNGGSVACLQGDNSSQTEGCIISSCGEGLTKIKMSEFSVTRNGLLEADVKAEYDYREVVREVQCGWDKNKDCILVRGRSKCEVLKADNSSDGTVLCNVGTYDFTEEETPTSICVSPYIVGENLIATNKGNVYLWKPGDRKEQVLNSVENRFYSHCQWRQTLYGAHPRHVILADRTAVQAFDMRRRSSDGIDIFALPSRHLNPHERIQVIAQYPGSQHHCLLATDYSLFLLDERFPCHPILTWYHTSAQPPTYLTCLPSVGDGDLDLITMSSQSLTDVCCFTVNLRSSETPVGLGSPFQISSIDDMTYWPEICNGPTRIIARDRFCTSLAGVTTTHVTNGFCVFQLDSYGDMFYQTYEGKSSDCDKTFSTGPESHDLNIDNYITIAQDWLSKVTEAVRVRQEAERCERSKENTKINATMKELIPPWPVHIRCNLCTMTSDPGYHGISGDDDLFMDSQSDDQDLCYSCLQQISEGKKIIETDKDYPAQSYTDPDITEVTIVTTSADNLQQTDAISQIFLKLWREDYDLDEELEKRDEEIQARKKKIDPTSDTAKSTRNKSKSKDQIDQSEQPHSSVTSMSVLDIENFDNETIATTSSNTITGYDLEDPDLDTVISDLTESNPSDTVTPKVLLCQSVTTPPRRRRRHSSASSNISRLSSLSVLSRQSDGFRSTPTKVLRYWQSEQNKPEKPSTSDIESDLFGSDRESFSLFTQSQENFTSVKPSMLSKQTEGSPRKKKKFVTGF